jgi:hypothetical protein
MDDIQRQYNRTLRLINETNARLSEMMTASNEQIAQLTLELTLARDAIADLKRVQDFDSVQEVGIYELFQPNFSVTCFRGFAHKTVKVVDLGPDTQSCLVICSSSRT